MNWEIVGICFYVGIMIGLGIYFSSRIQNDDDYYLGGRSLGPGLATFSIFATWFGAETCIGTAGAVYRNGLSSIHADPMGYTICLFLMGLFFAKALWKKKITTLPDLFRERFSVNTERLAALIIIPSSIIWAGAQVRALGQIVHATAGVEPNLAITLAALVVIIYTMFGGLLADAYSDFIQGIAIIGGLIFLIISLVLDMGGPVAAFSSIDTAKLSLGGGDLEGLSFLGKLELWMVPILGSVMAQELVSRVAASRSEHVAQQSAFRAGGIYLMIGSIPVLIGLLSVNYMPGLEHPETLMPTLAKQHLHYFFYVIFIGALISAILSTVDTTLLACSALLSHNLVLPVKKEISEKSKVKIARLATLVSGVLSYGVAYSSESIIELVETASSLGGPSILVLTIIALWVKKGTALNAIIAMVSSVGAWVAAQFFLDIEYPVILTVVVCAVSYFGSLPFTPEFIEEKVEINEVELG